MGAAEALGREIDDDERAVVVSERPAASTMYLGLDGTGVPVRKEAVEGRAGKQPGDGTAKTREVKLVTVWTAETRNKEGRPMRDPGSVTYSAVIASAASRNTDREPSVFAQHTRREVERSCFVQAERCVARKRASAASTWTATATGCSTRPSALADFASVPASSRPAARSLLALG